MKISNNGNQVTVCKDNICLTVVGEFAKALAFAALIATAAVAVNEIAKLLK
jgi:hypothetical protein